MFCITGNSSSGIERLNKSKGLKFFDLYTFTSFYKREPVNLSGFATKLIEELRILLSQLELNIGFPQRSKSTNSLSEKHEIFTLTDCNSSKYIEFMFVKQWQC